MPDRVLHGAVSGPDVEAVQTTLLRLGFDPGRPDGVYGPRTAAAVHVYQRSRGLPADGVVAAPTWARLAAEEGSTVAGRPLRDVLRGAIAGQTVREVQTTLRRAGFPPGRVDGVYGPDTARAVRNFQYVHGLAPDGLVGPATREALLTRQLGLSPSVVGATVDPARPAVPSELVGRLLSAHREYGGGRARGASLVPDGAEVALPALRWLREVRTLFDPSVAPVLHGRTVVLGLALLDRSTGAALRLDGLLDAVVEELREPLDALLTPRGQLLRARDPAAWLDLRRLSPSSVRALAAADALRRGASSSEVHMEHLLAGCLAKPSGPARRLLDERLGPDGFGPLVAAAVGTALPDPAAPVPLQAVPPLSEHAGQAVDHAFRLADAVDSGTVRSRFLLHGALTVRGCSLVRALEERGVRADDVERWDEPTGAAAPAAAPVLLAGASADTVPEPGGGRVRAADRLGTAEDVECMVSVLLARNTPLPLAVGLFGDWGSGKSFFMALMQERMQELAELARAGSPEAEPYCSEIRQIRFNAWHYVDADLWSSLAATLFDELARPSEVDTATAKVDQLDKARDEVEQAHLAKERLADEAERLEEELQQPRSAVRTSLSAAIREVRTDRKLREHLKAAADRGAPDADGTARLVAALEAAEQSTGTGRAVWRLAQEEVLGRRRWVTAVTAVVVLTAAAAATWLTQLPAVGKAAAALGALLAAAAPPLHGALRVLFLAREVREAQEAPLLEARHELARAEAKEAAAVREVARLERELETLRDASEQLREFVRERAASSDYRARLGVISAVRRDFEQLVALLPRSLDGAAPDGAPRRLPPVERIVLYVDDLDRCPPGKVVEVLQAVHLLLAFELFVVVVGVDSRWLERSLSEHYQDLLLEPDNYLEKIFQIPFTLRSLTGPCYSDLVEALEQVRASASSAPSTADEAGRVPGPPGSVPQPEPPVTPPPPGVLPLQDPPVVRAPVLAPRPQALVLTDEERLLLGRLGAVVTTPRSAKRLMNIYRMLRVSVPPDEADAFSPAGGREYEAVVVLVGLLVGRPQVAAEVVRRLLAASDEDEVWPVFAAFPELAPLLELRSATTLDRAAAYRRWAPRVSRYSFRRQAGSGAAPPDSAAVPHEPVLRRGTAPEPRGSRPRRARSAGARLPRR